MKNNTDTPVLDKIEQDAARVEKLEKDLKYAKSSKSKQEKLKLKYKKKAEMLEAVIEKKKMDLQYIKTSYEENIDKYYSDLKDLEERARSYMMRAFYLGCAIGIVPLWILAILLD